MMLSPVLFLFTLALGQTVLFTGNLYYFTPEKYPVLVRLGTEKNKVVGNGALPVVKYHDTGALFFSDNKKYLGVDKYGKFVMSEKPDTRFALVDKVGSQWTQILFYKGDGDFQLCEDGSIGYKSKCKGAQTISVEFEKTSLE
ncbi:hypothetical protein JCM33374_g5100 [Metschnikowia sp. JCM 33374]|nr:hypothetical protein JCM33374_g5100 [Metschnikowia sp. JCM 33374]